MKKVALTLTGADMYWRPDVAPVKFVSPATGLAANGYQHNTTEYQEEEIQFLEHTQILEENCGHVHFEFHSDIEVITID